MGITIIKGREIVAELTSANAAGMPVALLGAGCTVSLEIVANVTLIADLVTTLPVLRGGFSGLRTSLEGG